MIGPNDERFITELAEKFAAEYVQFVNEQLAKHLPVDVYYKRAASIVLMQTGSFVCAALASAVWSANVSKRINNAGNN